ncbi:MAG: hypothetical protein E6Q68_06860 [Polynucleobacter sp.]|nr:MAG: hypothetical protein E6Q68_06860 [Polynucleobacter sp.]
MLEQKNNNAADAQTKSSGFRLYSIGIAAANLELNSIDLEVTPTEDMPMVDGELTSNVKESTTKGKETEKSNYSVNTKSTVTVTASWLPIFKSNRLTAPNVRRGEKLILMRFSDADKYYWDTFSDDAHLRKLETVIYNYSNTRKEEEKNTPDKSYWMEISTHKKLIHLHTSKNDGEHCVYDIQVDTKNGQVVIIDDIGNFISLNSRDTNISMKNADGTFLELNRNSINGYASDSINFETNNFNIKCNSYSQNAGSSSSIDAPNISHSSSNHSISSTNVGVSASSTSFNSGGSSMSMGGGGIGVNSNSFTHNGNNVGDSHTHTGVHGETSPPH